MQRPATMTWSMPKCIGETPSRRSGHSFCIIGDNAYLFGGNDFRRPPGPNNDLYKLEMSSSDFFWTKIETSGRCPEPRSHHSVVVYGTKMIVFGGFRSSSIRYNDVWIFDTTNDEWSQPHAGATETRPDGEVVFKRIWPEVPLPRGAHSATLIGGSQMYIFGGYGGAGYARRDFNDVSVLDLETWEWRAVECGGEVPDARSGHQGVAVQDNLYIIGGWNSMEQFKNMYVLDITSNTWTKSPVLGDFGPPRWNFSAVSIFAVPYWKIFVFGGNSGDLNDGASPQGEFLNDTCVLETGTKTWTRPQVLGTVPLERSETPIVYDPRQSRIILFGGWANRWFGDLYVCKVGEVVGPPYSIDTIHPQIGPITGATRCSINGVGFRSGGNQATIRFACMRGYVECPGEVSSDTLISFDTPNFEKYGPTVVEGRVGVGGKSLTNSTINFSYFSVASCDTTLAFGTGLISGCISGCSVTVIIQARDAAGLNRVCGMDEFTVTVSNVVFKREREIAEPIDACDLKIVDQQDGTYLVNFVYPAAGKYEVAIVFKGTFQGKAGHIRGSPFRINVTDTGDGPLMNELNGPLLMERIRKHIKESKEYSVNSLKSLKKTIPKEDCESLIRVKETLRDIEQKKEGMELDLDCSRAALMYFKKQGGQMDKTLEQLDNSASMWQEVTKQVPFTAFSIVPLVKTWTGIIEEQIEAYNKEMQQKLKDFKLRSFWGDDITPEQAVASMTDAEKFLATENEEFMKKCALVRTFDIPQLIKPASDAMEEMTLDLTEMKRLWAASDVLQQFIAESKKILWAEMNTDELDEGSKNQVKAVKALHKNTRWCKAYKLADKLSKDFLNTIPLISLLGAKCMRERHWISLQTVTKKNFVPPYADKNLLLGGILDLKLHEFTADVEDICDQALKELKIENTIAQLDERWLGIEWIMEPYKDSDVPLLKLNEEDFEALEADQLTVQGMLASRFVKQFEQEAMTVTPYT